LIFYARLREEGLGKLIMANRAQIVPLEPRFAMINSGEREPVP
jgi:hypothetical protein